MSTCTGVGTSVHRDPRRAAQEAAQAALSQAGVESAQTALVFATVGYPQQPLVAAVQAALPGADVFGCSGEGVIAQQITNESNHSVAVMVWNSSSDHFKSVSARGLAEDSRGAGRSIAEQLGPVPDDAVALMVLADGLTLNYDEFTAGLAEVWPDASLPLVGGTSGDNWRLKQTWQYQGGEVFSDGVVCALLTGGLRLATGASHGCQPIGTSHTITKADGTLILELDDRPVLDVLGEYLEAEELADFTKAIMNLSLGFRAPNEIEDAYDEYIIRYMPAKDDERGAVRIPTEVEAGTQVWMTRRNAEKMYGGVESLAASLKERMNGDRPALVLHFDCAGRGKQMFREHEKTRLVLRLQELVGKDVPWIGFYSFGEIGPVKGQNFFHNYTAVVAGLY